MAYVENIVYNSPDFKINIPSWSFPDEGITCLWGPSGAGKSTTLQIMAGLINSPKLRLIVRDQSPDNIGFVFQDYLLFPHMTVLENLHFAAEAKKIDKSAADTQIQSLMSNLKLERVSSTKARFLSGGEQQRVALARALIGKPQILFLDEPLSSLDAHLREEARTLIINLSREYKIPFIFVTHDLRDVRMASQSLMVMDVGLSIAQGSTEELLNRPTTLNLAKLIPDNQLLEATKTQRWLPLNYGQVPRIRRQDNDPQTYILAKEWSFEIVAFEKRNLEAKFNVKEVYDEGFFRKIYGDVEGYPLKAVSLLPTSQLQGSQRLKVDQTTLCLLQPSNNV